jgi:hypothetical protein
VRAGKYLLVFEIVDPEARDRYFPAEGQGSDEIGRFDEQNRQAADAWKRLHALGPIATSRPITSSSPSSAAAHPTAGRLLGLLQESLRGSAHVDSGGSGTPWFSKSPQLSTAAEN